MTQNQNGISNHFPSQISSQNCLPGTVLDVEAGLAHLEPGGDHVAVLVVAELPSHDVVSLPHQRPLARGVFERGGRVRPRRQGPTPRSAQ